MRRLSASGVSHSNLPGIALGSAVAGSPVRRSFAPAGAGGAAEPVHSPHLPHQAFAHAANTYAAETTAPAHFETVEEYLTRLRLLASIAVATSECVSTVMEATRERKPYPSPTDLVNSFTRGIEVVRSYESSRQMFLRGVMAVQTALNTTTTQHQQQVGTTPPADGVYQSPLGVPVTAPPPPPPPPSGSFRRRKRAEAAATVEAAVETLVQPIAASPPFTPAPRTYPSVAAVETPPVAPERTFAQPLLSLDAAAVTPGSKHSDGVRRSVTPKETKGRPAKGARYETLAED